MKRSVSTNLYVTVHNLHGRVKGYPRLESVPKSDRLRVCDGTISIDICRRMRVALYKRSVQQRLQDLQRAYLLDNLQVSSGAAFIDCGANVGELGWFARSRGLVYHAFEPEPLEAECCDVNNFDGAPRTNRTALWSETTTLSFYSKPETADGSLVEIGEYDNHFDVPAQRLDDYVARNGIQSVAVLKVEAEGAEPEVLRGAEETLRITRFVTVDCGFERGVQRESTVVPVTNFLLERGFALRDWHPHRLIFLFENQRP